jgi:hypothetical protein
VSVVDEEINGVNRPIAERIILPSMIPPTALRTVEITVRVRFTDSRFLPRDTAWPQMTIGTELSPSANNREIRTLRCAAATRRLRLFGGLGPADSNTLARRRQPHRMRHERVLALRKLAIIHAMPPLRLQRPAPMEAVHAAAPVIEHQFYGLAAGGFDLDHFLHGFLKLYGHVESRAEIKLNKANNECQ